MLTGEDFYHVLSALAPLYVAMMLAYVSVRWWKLFTPEQCAGINRLVALFSIPFYSFNFITSHDPYSMNLTFVLSDTIQKTTILVCLLLWEAFSKNGTLDWVVALFSLATLPNTLIIGIPLLTAMYGEYSGGLMVQLVLLQGVVWYTVILILLEYKAAKILVTKQLSPDVVRSIASFRMEPDITSLNDHESLCAETESLNDGRVHVLVRNLTGSKSRRSSLAGLDYNPVESLEVAAPRSSGVNQHEDVCVILEKSRSDRSSISSKSRGPEFPDVPEMSRIVERRGSRNTNDREQIGPTLTTSASCLQRKKDQEAGGGDQADRKKQMPPANVMTWPIIGMVSRKMIKNPNLWASVLGIVWALISYKWNVQFPVIISKSITTLANTCPAMSMFTLGFFMALQPKLITCGKCMAFLAMLTRFLVGPLVAGAVSAAVGLRGDVLRISIVQAALPQAIASFVYAKEYDSHPDIMSTAVIFSLILALPITLIYFILLGL